MAQAPGIAGRRAPSDRPPFAETRSARRGSCRSRSGDRRGRARRRRREAADDHHRRQADSRSQHHGGDRRHPQVRPSGKACELLWAQSAGPPVGLGPSPPRAHQQGRAQPCARDAGRGGLDGRQGAGPIACLLRAHPGKAGIRSLRWWLRASLRFCAGMC